MLGMGRAIAHLRQPLRIVQPADGRGALRAQRALVDRAARVAFDVDHPAGLGVDELRAAHSAIGADGRADGVGLLQARAQGARSVALRGLRSGVGAHELARKRPVAQEAPRTLCDAGTQFFHRDASSDRASAAVKTLLAMSAIRSGARRYLTVTGAPAIRRCRLAGSTGAS